MTVEIGCLNSGQVLVLYFLFLTFFFTRNVGYTVSRISEEVIFLM